MADYTAAKVLYFASRAKGLHVHAWEFENQTTLAKLVTVALRAGLLEERTEDQGLNFHYFLTPEGWTEHRANCKLYHEGKSTSYLRRNRNHAQART